MTVAASYCRDADDLFSNLTNRELRVFQLHPRSPSILMAAAEPRRNSVLPDAAAVPVLVRRRAQTPATLTKSGQSKQCELTGECD